MHEIGLWEQLELAPERMGISRSTLERMRRRGEVEEIRQYNRVYILVTEPRTDTDSDLLEEARAELAESETSRMELGSEVQRLRDRLSVMSDRVESAENRESRARAEASWSKVEASWASVEKQNTDRQLIGERQDRQHLTWALAAVSAIAAMLLILLII